MTPEFRAGVFSLQPDEVKEDEVGKEDDVDPIQKEQLISMGFLESMAIRAIRKFPKPDQEVQRIEWMLSGKNASDSSNCQIPLMSRQFRRNILKREYFRRFQESSNSCLHLWR
jgi:hypothetical protein